MLARAEDGRVVFVTRALPGERVVAEVVSTMADFLRATAVEVLEPSTRRTVPPCAHFSPAAAAATSSTPDL